MMMDVWYISCSTGCTCCAYEDFDWGFYISEEEANNQANQWREGKDNPLASQYARYGRYRVVKAQAEVLPDGRLIVDRMVYDPIETTGLTAVNGTWRD